MPHGFREILQFYLIDCRTALGKAIDIVIVFLNLVICAILVIETYPVSEATSRLLWRSEMIIVLFFIVEYAARIYAAKKRRCYENKNNSCCDIPAFLAYVSRLGGSSSGTGKAKTCTSNNCRPDAWRFSHAV